MHFVPWKHYSFSDADAVVVPDGCRDILLIQDAYSDSSIKLTDWDDQARTVRLRKGHSISGFRLCPGLSVNGNELFGLEAKENDIREFIESLAAANSGYAEKRIVPVLAIQLLNNRDTDQQLIILEG